MLGYCRVLLAWQVSSGWILNQKKEDAVVSDLPKVWLARGISWVVSWTPCCSCSPAMYFFFLWYTLNKGKRWMCLFLLVMDARLLILLQLQPEMTGNVSSHSVSSESDQIDNWDWEVSPLILCGPSHSVHLGELLGLQSPRTSNRWNVPAVLVFI